MQRYQPHQTWQHNLENAPNHRADLPVEPVVPGAWSWCGLPLESPLGIPAGPLLNAQWLLYYADLGFDWLVYKTVRSHAHPCHPLPNLIPVGTDPIHDPGTHVSQTDAMDSTWAVSFGMPSQAPAIWKADVEWARRHLHPQKQLVVSVVATPDLSLTDPIESLEQIAEDFARCARWAVDSGADGIEANFSCPNVGTLDGQLYQRPAAAKIVAQRIRSAIGDVPLALKIGFISIREQAECFLDAVSSSIQGLCMTNSIQAKVKRNDGTFLFQAQPRGICGKAIREASLKQTRLFADLVQTKRLPIAIIGVGGISETDDVRAYLDAGAACVGMATAIMVNPHSGLDIRRSLSKSF